MKNKYIKLFETWQWLNRDADKATREYQCTIDDLLNWAIGQLDQTG